MHFPAVCPLLCIPPEFSTHLDELRAQIKLWMDLCVPHKVVRGMKRELTKLTRGGCNQQARGLSECNMPTDRRPLPAAHTGP